MKYVAIGIVVIVLCVAGYFSFNWYQDKRLIKETVLRTESEMRFKQLVIENKQRQIAMDSLKQDKIKLQAILEYQQNNPSVIIKKTNEIHVNIDNLDAVNSMLLFTNNAREYAGQRERYLLKRFTK